MAPGSWAHTSFCLGSCFLHRWPRTLSGVHYLSANSNISQPGVPKTKLPIQCCSPPFVPMRHHVSCLCRAAEGEASGRLDGELTIIIITLPKMHRGLHSTYTYSSCTYFSFTCQKARGTKCKAKPEPNGANPTLVEPCLRGLHGQQPPRRWGNHEESPGQIYIWGGIKGA